MRLDQGNRGGSVFFSGWINKLKMGRGQRRGSLGFSDQTLSDTNPPLRMDEDSNGESWEKGNGAKRLGDGALSTSPRREGLTKRRNDSYSKFDTVTPGGDGDLYMFQSKFSRRNESDSNLVGNSYGQQDITQGIAGFSTQGTTSSTQDTRVSTHQTTSSTQETRVSTHGSGLQLTNEGMLTGSKPIVQETDQRYADDRPRVQDTPSKSARKQGNDEEEEEGSIFLIDLEELEGDSKKGIKVQTKKFSASSLLRGSKLTHNWFFRNKEEDKDSLVEEENVRKESSNSEDEDMGEEDKMRMVEEDKSIMKKLRSLVDRNHPPNMREMNMWQPQSS